MQREFENLAGPVAGSDHTVGSVIHHFEAVTSTMDVAWEQANKGAVDGTVIVADHQSQGRGRFDRSWVSEPGKDILCSVVLRPRVSLAGELLMLAALAVVDVAKSFGIDAGIKWPNDVQVAGKKLAGVIAESVSGPVAHEPEQSNDPGPDHEPPDQNATEHVVAVIGIGLNVNFNLTGYEGTMPDPTSISAELGGQVDRVVVLKRLLRSLDGHYSELSAGDTIVPAWRAKLTTLGKMVTITSGSPGGSTKMHGLAHDVDSIGRLIVRDADGRNWPVSAGEVTLQDTS